MKDNFDELNKALNTASDIVKAEPEEMKIVKSLKSEDKDIQKDYEWILSQNKEFNATIIDESNNYSLLAIQGPKAIDYCQKFTDVELNKMKNFTHSISKFAKTSCTSSSSSSESIIFDMLLN